MLPILKLQPLHIWLSHYSIQLVVRRQVITNTGIECFICIALMSFETPVDWLAIDVGTDNMYQLKNVKLNSIRKPPSKLFYSRFIYFE